MPIYEYECGACGAQHEFIQKFSEGPKRKCPSCGKSRLRKRVSAAAFHLKGGGWYVTDFRDKGKSGANGSSKGKSEAGAEGAGAAKSETKSDTKSETKTESKADAKSGSGSKASGSSASAS
ncbi:MAG: zinc ribbon domain-containing protein [Chromatiales bacterium]|nr:zinc ribbon domain-containing protein [Chromatiales bacterium]